MHLIYQAHDGQYSAPIRVALAAALCKHGFGGIHWDVNGAPGIGWSLEIATAHEFIDDTIRNSRHRTALHAHLPDQPALVFDIAPDRPLRSLFRATRVFGFSEQKWTPLMFELEELGEHKAPTPNDPEIPIQCFNAPAPRQRIYEFLYLQWGLEGGMRRSWGRTGWVNAALLYPHHLKYFLPLMKEPT